MSKDLETSNGTALNKSQFLVYEAEDGQVKIDVRLEGETVWLTQQLVAELFQTTKQNVGQHLKKIFSEGELSENSVVKKFFTTAADGKKYQTMVYNLDAIISVGYLKNEKGGQNYFLTVPFWFCMSAEKGYIILRAQTDCISMLFCQK
jgi:hypothetical protein